MQHRAPRLNFLLPWPAREALRRAAETPVTDADPLARRRAIDKTLQRLRNQYPDYFRKD
jgi:hypothetical protein